MKEQTSQYDDLEKRMAVYLGLGALLFTSLYHIAVGADLLTFLVRGAAALILVSILGWSYFHWLSRLIKTHSEEEQLPDNVERQSRDAKPVESRIVSAGDLAETVIPAEAMPAGISDFQLADLETPIESAMPDTQPQGS